MLPIHRKIIYPAAVTIVVLSAFLLALHFGERKAERLGTTRVDVEVRQYYVVEEDGKPAFYFTRFNADSTLYGIAFDKDSISYSTLAQWRRHLSGRFANRWAPLPSCGGRLVVDVPAGFHIAANAIGKAVLDNERTAIDSIVKTKDIENDELTYYLRVHGVQDEGYTMIARYHGRVDSALHRYRRLRLLLNKMQKGSNVTIRLQRDFTAVYTDDSGRVRREACTFVGQKGNRIRLRLVSESTPSGVRLYCWPWTKVAANPTRQAAIQQRETTDSLGRRIYGHFEGDTLTSGIRIDSAGVYAGQLNSKGIANGHGRYEGFNGTYYEGSWKADMRQDFGFTTSPKRSMRAGEWQHDVYKGERLVYSTDHIYGIDISKYQHEIKRKKYGIDWSQLRITHLGSYSRKKVKGVVDFPVRFIFIKATEGTTIRNKWFAADYRDARAHGKHVGAYHFFSLKSRGSDQARHFLHTARFSKGDLPPVLDVECFPSQIRKVGADVMWTNIRAFLKVVEQQTGVKPVIYTNQTFINRYLPMVPDIVRDYQVWIARYGEYKPEIRLAFWQLSQDGRVSGIHGTVDINVFNGYEDEYKAFLRANVIP